MNGACSRRAESGWRAAIEQIAKEHDLLPCELEPYAKGETIVWRAGQYVIKLTIPHCAYQIEAEVGCLGATHGKLSLATPRLHAHGSIHDWPYVIMSRIGGYPIGDVWPELDHDQRRRLARDLGIFCRELHTLQPAGFAGGWSTLWRTISRDVATRHAAFGGPAALVAAIDPFLAKVGELVDESLVPLHTELIDQHVYVEERRGRVELCGLIDFADARLGPAHYEFSAPVEFIFKGEPGLLREFLLAYGIPESRLTPSYSEMLLAWALYQRFSNLKRLLAVLGPREPSSLEELAVALFSVSPE